LRVINLFGGPGAGKSTTSAGLFFKMKNDKKIKSVELVTEFAKDLVYAERKKELEPSNQLYITAKQYGRLYRLNGKVDYVITDSPIIQGLMYAPEEYFTSFPSLVRELFDSFDNINIFVNRTKAYRNYGRVHTEEESDVVSERILDFLNNNQISYTKVDGNDSAPDTIKNLLKGKGEWIDGFN
jgi:hypothetical protein